MTSNYLLQSSSTKYYLTYMYLHVLTTWHLNDWYRYLLRATSYGISSEIQNWPSVFPSPILRDPLLPACMAPMMPSMYVAPDHFW